MSHASPLAHAVPPEMLTHYARGSEEDRLTAGPYLVELARTRELLIRFLPPPPAVVYDVGGGAGVHALWLARQGYAVHLVEPVPLHVAQAQHASDMQPDAPLASCVVGDALHLDRADASVNAALLLGPLYHLPMREHRVAALHEAARVLKPSGVILAAAISRFASLQDGLLDGLLGDPVFAAIMQEDLQSGQHRNPTGDPRYFTTAYFHHPAELAGEVAEAGLTHVHTLAVEGPAGLIARVWEQWGDTEWQQRVLAALRQIEAEPSLLGASRHLLAVSRKPTA